MPERERRTSVAVEPADEQTGRELARRTRQQAAVARLGQRALAGAGVGALLDEAVRALADNLEVELTEVLECQPDGTLLVRAGIGWSDGLVGSVHISGGPETQAGYVLAASEPVIVEDLRTETRFTGLRELHEHGVVSGLSVLIEAHGSPYGVLAAHTRQRRVFSDHDVHFLQAIANVLGGAVERRRGEEQLRETARQLELTLQAARLGAWRWDVASGSVSWSAQLEQIAGLAPGAFGGAFEDYAGFIHPDDRDWVLDLVGKAVAEGTDLAEFEHRVSRSDGSVRWILCAGGALRDDAGALLGLVGVAMDITDRKLAEEERARLLRAEHEARMVAEAARARMEFLARSTSVLAGVLDHREALRRLAETAIAGFADCCTVDLLEDGVLERAALVHRDARKAGILKELRRRYPPRPGTHHPLLRALETAESQYIPAIDDAALQRLTTDPQQYELARLLKVTSAIIVPLVAAGRSVGVLSFAVEDGRHYDPEDFEVARDLGRRIGLAIENSELYQERADGERRFRRLAATLQESLLPPRLPEIAGLELAAVYRPAARGVDVGGDFYDVFPLPERGWGLVIGDVCGKGPEAAKRTALARYTLRATAVQEPRPSLALAGLNAVLIHDEANDPETETRFLTSAFARAQPMASGVTLALSLAGHPRPFVLRADGEVEAVGEPGSLLGVMADVELVDATVVLSPGDTLLLYTDGLIEARAGSEAFGGRRAAEALRVCHGLSAQELVDRLEGVVVSFSGGIDRDDLALLALRVLER